MVRFSDRETKKFLYLLRKHKYLWSTELEKLRQAACGAIAHEMNIQGFTAADVKGKIHSLKGTYNIEIANMKKFALAGKNYETKLKWFSIMDSLIKKLRLPGNNLSSKNVQSIIPEDNQWEQQCEEDSTAALVSVSSTPLFPSESVIDQTVKSVLNPKNITVTQSAPQMQQRANQVSSDETLGSRKRCNEEKSSPNKFRRINKKMGELKHRCEDEMDAYGRYVALNLRKMTIDSALAAETEILGILMNHRLDQHETSLPPKRMFPYVLANGTSPAQNQVVPQKVDFKR